jgi:hypothetical protein
MFTLSFFSCGKSEEEKHREVEKQRIRDDSLVSATTNKLKKEFAIREKEIVDSMKDVYINKILAIINNGANNNIDDKKLTKEEARRYLDGQDETLKGLKSNQESFKTLEKMGKNLNNLQNLQRK